MRSAQLLAWSWDHSVDWAGRGLDVEHAKSQARSEKLHSTKKPLELKVQVM